jgi:DNA repair photolyase
VLLEAGFTPLVLTRAARVTDDRELLARFPRAAVGLSIPTDDDAVRRIFEPGGDPIDERLEALALCHAAGIRTFGVVQPMLPMTPERLVEKMAPHVSVVRIDRMHELARSRAMYEAAGRLDASEDAFFERTSAALRAGFLAAGVAVDDLDDVGGALGLA